MVMLAGSRANRVARGILFIITLKVMLASCAPEPVDATEEKVSGPNMDAPFQETTTLSDKITVSIIYNFSTDIRVVIRNSEARSVFLSPNFDATSRLLIYDGEGSNRYTSGFEGRPRRDAVQEIPRGAEFSYGFGKNVLRSEDFAQAERICVRVEWSFSRENIDPRRDLACIAINGQ